MDYYNELDTAIGRELSGCDVIDELESEQKEVLAAGNRFFVYSNEVWNALTSNDKLCCF